MLQHTKSEVSSSKSRARKCFSPNPPNSSTSAGANPTGDKQNEVCSMKNSYLNSESEIPSFICEYPRRIILSLCLSRRRVEIDNKERLDALQSETVKFRRKEKPFNFTQIPTQDLHSNHFPEKTNHEAMLEIGKSPCCPSIVKNPKMYSSTFSSSSSSSSSSSTSSSSSSKPSHSRTSVLTARRFWRTIFIVLFYLLILVDSSAGCGPGRGAGRRRAPRKLTPLVYKQHVPNVPENTLSASGLNEGKINRDHPRFKALVPNYNADVIFRDDEGTGADRLMSQRCKEKLNTLAISVMNQWPGVRLRVIEGWDEGNHHSTSSLHYEGRAVDITTSDKDRSKYGMLARLAVEAGFDWVYYESRAHIHCSVKSDSSQAARTGGCFSENATVRTPEGRRKITEVQPGDSVLSMDEEGKPVFSEVLMFLDRNSTETREFYHVTTSSGSSLSLTPSHLIFKVDRILGDSLSLLENNNASDLLQEARVTFARNIEAGDWLLVVSELGSNVTLEKVVRMEARVSTGVYAPLTKQGNVIVDGILASCYAVINDQSLAHWAFSPVRFVVNLYEGVGHAWRQFSHFITFRPLQSSSHYRMQSRNDPSVVHNQEHDSSIPAQEQGVHWYASFLYAATKYLIPSHLLYGSE